VRIALQQNASTTVPTTVSAIMGHANATVLTVASTVPISDARITAMAMATVTWEQVSPVTTPCNAVVLRDTAGMHASTSNMNVVPIAKNMEYVSIQLAIAMRASPARTASSGFVQPTARLVVSAISPRVNVYACGASRALVVG